MADARLWKASAAALGVAAALCAGAAPPAPSQPPEDSDLLTLDEKGYVRDWLVLVGVPFSLNPKAVTSPGDFIYGESQLQPREGYVFTSDRMAATKVLRWRKHRAPNGAVDFAKLGGGKDAMHYAAAYLVSGRAMTVRARLEGVRYAVLRVNGRGPAPETFALNEGRNVLLVRVRDTEGRAGFRLRITAPDGKTAIPELRVALAPTAEPAERRLRSDLQPDPAFVVFPKPAGRISYLPDELAPQVRRMAARAMKFLVESQQASGAWSDTHYPDSVGVTALCCLALMAEGNLPRQGPHGKALDKGLEFLLGSFKDEGVCASAKVEGYGVMYGHALATLALLEANGNMPWRPELGDRISKALQTILRYQRVDGGWRYELTRTGDSDISVTTTVLWALGQAKRYGYTVPRESIEKALRFVQRCGRPDGRFMYRLNGKTKVQPHSGVGVAALYGAGRIDHPLLPRARDLIAAEYQRYSVKDLAGRRYLMFGSFFAALTIYSSGYDLWRPWYTKMVRVIASKQQPDGDVPDRPASKVYPTALAAIILQAPNGYLSIFVQ